MESPSNESILTAISTGLHKDGKLYESIYKSPVRDLGKFYERATKEVQWEEAFGLKKPSNQKKGGEHISQNKKRGDDNARKEGQGQSPNDQTAKKVRYEQGVERPARQGRYDNYSVFSDSQDMIFTTERNKDDFRRPNPLKTPDKYRTKSKFCAYHNEVGHTTSECWVLKDTIEKLIRKGRLRHYVVRPRDQQSKQPAQLSPHRAPEPDQTPTVRTIFTIHGGPHITRTSDRSHKRYVREADHLLLIGDGSQGEPSKKARMASDDIFFTKNDSKDLHWPHNDALVIRARIGNMEVRRIMVDTGSLVNVMYRGCYDQMGLRPDQLIASPEPLYGFTSDAVIPKGRIKLLLTVRGADLQTTAMADFLIIDSPLAYNVVMERPVMNDLDLVISTKALTVKFPTLNGTGHDSVEKNVNMVSGGEARIINSRGVSHDLDLLDMDCDRAASPANELEDVAVSNHDAERRLQIGKGLSP
ncbi:uncharacterized protein LOC127787496 [Diospyros lotus]|uniref:uncharacterized protein LOC127787496 n=1 Tax=Diospyros lotus TaxID=55363 RepID=UPI0022576B5A|nr:uncharacterized protein LOC127787496 [Diospyros lotus]